MPIYEYKCKACCREFELLVGSWTAEVACPECGSADCVRLLSVFGFSSGGRFKSSAPGGECSGCSKTSCRGCR